MCVCVCVCVCKKAAASARAAFHSIFIDSTFALSLCIEHQGRCEEKEKAVDEKTKSPDILEEFEVIPSEEGMVMARHEHSDAAVSELRERA